MSSTTERVSTWDVIVLVIMTLLGVGDTVFIALLMWTYNRNNPLGCTPVDDSNTTTRVPGVSSEVPCTYDNTHKEDYAIFINQATGMFYCFISIPLLFLQRRYLKVETDPTKQAAPRWILIIIGLLNGTGNFCAGVGQVHTGGTSQALLQLVGIPVVLLLSWVLLKQRPSLWATIGSAFILGGTALSALPHAKADSDSLWYSVVLFFSAQLFFSGEKVFEESTFGKYNIDVLWMFIWTLYTQVTLGWITWPVQSVDAFGGIDVHNIPSIFVDGCKCTVGIATPGRPYCDWRNSVLFFVYCTIDYSYYAIGLYVIQTRGASLMILATAIALPLSQLTFCLKSLVGAENYSTFLYTDAIALVMVRESFVPTGLKHESPRRELLCFAYRWRSILYDHLVSKKQTVRVLW
eukprot:m.676198 g.676198  ORF g.676198 m.676198 type:complete len:406 (-) comp22788_c1_seq99:879-2096(-)